MRAGIGVHVGDRSVRAVLVEAEARAARVVSDATEPVGDDHGDGFDAALVRLAARLPAGAGVPAHIARDTHPVGATDVTGLDAAALDQLFGRRAAAGDDAVVVASGAGGRRLALTLSWDEGRADALTAAARRAGFAAGGCEPAAAAAHRDASGDPALGAALAAAGLAPAAAVHRLRSAAAMVAPRPWVLERVPDGPVADVPAAGRWRRRLGALRARRRGGGARAAR